MADPLINPLASNTPTSAWRSDEGTDPHVEITGSGSGTITVEYQCLDGSFAPSATGSDGGSPIILDKFAYAGSPIRVGLDPGRNVRVNPGTITGTVTATFVDN